MNFFKALLLFCLLTLGGLSQTKAQNYPFTKPGTFSIGCNYWASHAGTHMWQDWKPEVIDADFKQLSENGIKVLRVFPLWPDFQPIYQVYANYGDKKYISFKDGPLPQTPAGQNGVSELQLQHFKVLADLAEKHHLKLVVGLITGWMSGQLYVPPALEGKNILSDPESLTWQQKFVTTFAGRFKNHNAIIAWDFGNECNVMENLSNHYQAYVWSALIAGAIKSIDRTRPVISGMHGETAADNAPWRIVDQAAVTDVLTTHPYSLWTSYASQDGINTMRTILHGSAENSLYADIGGKPSMVEETGVMGPMTGGETEKAAFARTALFSNWANDCKGTFWWCAYDQTKLAYPPYQYASVEQELGLIKEDRTLKPVMNEFKKFSNFIDQLPFKELPPAKKEAVCILTENQDNWGVAYASYVLAKQAGFDFKFQKAGQEIADAPLYLLPSIKGVDPVFRDYWYKLLDKVKQGATLYISLDDAYLPTFDDPLGIEILTNSKRNGMLKFTGRNPADSLSFSLPAERVYKINPKKSTVLGTEADGNLAFLTSNFGKGKIFLLTFPLEMGLTTTPGAFANTQPAYRNIYKQIAGDLIKERIVTQQNPSVASTEHPIKPNEKVVVLINYNPSDANVSLNIKDGWHIKNSLYGELTFGKKQFRIKGNDALVLTVAK